MCVYDCVAFLLCTLVLQALRYTVVHNGNGVINSVNARVVLADVAAESAGGARFKQEFSVAFEKDGATEPAREKSGNPGYRSAYPVLFGVEELDTQGGTQKVAVSQFTTGLPVITRNERGICRLVHSYLSHFSQNLTESTSYFSQNLSTPSGRE